jgi:hypothetical protein
MERRFKQELLLARQVTHRNVVRIHDIGEINGTKFITMPFIEGEELAAIIRRKEKIPITRLLRITRGGAHQPDAGCPTVSESGGSCDSRARRVRREARREAASGDSIVFVLVRRSRGWRRRHTSFTSAAFRRTGRRTWAVFETSSLQSGAVCAFV